MPRVHSTWNRAQAVQASLKAAQLRTAQAQARKALAQLIPESVTVPSPTNTDSSTDPEPVLESHLSRLIRLNASPATIDRLALALSRLKRGNSIQASSRRRSGSSTVSMQAPVTEAIPMEEPEQS